MARWLEADAIEQVWRFRHACKQFDASRTIPEHDWEAILTAARLSPSSFGFEPWHFLVLQNRAVREALLPVAWGGRTGTISHGQPRRGDPGAQGRALGFALPCCTHARGEASR